MAMFKNVLVYALISILILPPSAMAQGGITPDAAAQAGKRPGMDAAANGVPVVNITAPNRSGLSHNQYSDFNVQKQGAILNNSATDNISQLGGIVLGNKNLSGAAPASTILNEVTSSNRSHIQGYLEVNGKKADVILANPNGITINGGGFINTGKATVTTGKPEFDGAGALRSFNVRQGDVRVEGDGINVNNLTAFDIVSRAAEINASIYANELNIVTGQNSYDPATGLATPLADDGSQKPLVAIDSTTLGGMYAGRITLTSNEKGVGVNLKGVVQSVNDMEITADGQLALRGAKSGGSMLLASNNDLVVSEAALADKNLKATAKNIILDKAVIGAKEQLDIQAKNKLSAVNGAEATSLKSASIKAAEVSLQNSSMLQSDNLSVVTKKLNITDGGWIVAEKLGVSANDVSLSNNSIIEGGTLTVTGNTSINVDGTSTIMAQKNATLTAAYLTNRGLIFAAKDLAFKIQDTLSNLDAADILAGGNISFEGLTAGSRMNKLHNQASNIESIGADININAETFFNDGGSPEAIRVNDGWEYRLIGWHNDVLLLTDQDNDISKYQYILDTPRWIPKTPNPYLANGNKNYISGIRVAKGGPISKDAQKGQVMARLQEMHDLYGVPNEYVKMNHAMQEWLEYSHDELVGLATPSSLLAAGNITFNVGDLINNYSTISAGGNIDITADLMENRGIELYNYMDVTRSFMEKHYYNNTNSSPGILYYQILLDTTYSAPATISAGGKLDLKVQKEIGNYIETADGQHLGTGAGTPDFKGLQGRPGDGSTGGGGKPGGSSGDYNWLPNFNLGGLFKPSGNPDHNYLIETNPKLTNLGDFYGSEYFLGKIGYDIAKEQTKLLGDAFFETRFVREQILAQSGQRYLYDGLTSDADTMLHLMDNAAREQSGLGLSVGVSLTPEQIAGLSSDIIWLEETEYNGQAVLVPRLYLCDATKIEVTLRGSNLMGSDVSIEGAGLLNQGNISGNNVSIGVKNDIVNQGGDILAKNTLIADAQGNIINRSGSLAGKDVLLSAGQDVIFETVAKVHQGNAFTWTETGSTASVEVGDSLSVSAGNNITMIGADLNVGGAATLNAANDVTLASQSISRSSGGSTFNFSQTGQLGTSLKAGSLDVNSDNNITISGSTVHSEGDAMLKAGGNVQVLSAAETFNSYEYSKSKSGGPFSKKRVSEESYSSVTQAGSLITSGKNLDVNAGGNIAVEGSGMMAGTAGKGAGNLNLAAGNEVLITTATESTDSYKNSSSKGLLSSSKKQSVNRSTTNVGSLLAGDNVNINAGSDILVSASDILAREDITLNAQDGNVVIAAAQDTAFSDSKSSKRGIGVFVGGGSLDVYRSEKTKNSNERSTSVASELNAGGNININAANDLTNIGSRLVADGDIKLGAGRDVNMLADTNSETSKSSKKTKAIGVSVSSTKDDAGVLDSVTVTAGYRSKTSKDEKSATYNVGNNLSAGGKLDVVSGKNINILGSNMKSGSDMQLASDNINVMSGYDTTYAEKYVKEVQAGLKLDISQTITGATKAGFNSIKESFDANNHDKDYEPKEFASPSFDSMVSLNYTKEVSRDTSNQSKVVASNINSGGNMNMLAQKDINIVGANVNADSTLTLAAGNNVSISSALESNTSSSTNSRLSLSNPLAEQYTGKSNEKTVTHKNVASALTGNDIDISAGNDIDVIASNVISDNDITLNSGNNINIGSAQNMIHTKTSGREYGLDILGRSAAAGTKSTEKTLTVDVGSGIVAGRDFTANAENNIDVKASTIYSVRDTTLDAGGDVAITAGETKLEEKKRINYAGYSEKTTATESKIRGFSGITYENSKEDHTLITALASNIEADGNLKINSQNKDVTVRGSELKAKQNIDIAAANNINLDSALETDKYRKEGTSVSVGVVAEASQSFTGMVRDTIDLAKNVKDNIKNFDGVSDTLSAVEIYQDGKKFFENAGIIKDTVLGEVPLKAELKVGGSIGFGNAKQTRDNTRDVASSMAAGGDISLDAGRDIVMRGTQASAGNNFNITAGDNLDVSAALTKTDEYTRSTTGGAFAGLSGTVGTQGNAFGIKGEINAGNSTTTNKSKIYQNAHISAGQDLNVSTGKDASIKGGNLKGGDVNMNVGGNLTVASVQNDIKIKNSSAGAGIGVTFGAGAAVEASDGQSGSDITRETATVQAKYTDTRSNKVGEQASIEGSGKVDIYVGGNTHLKGGKINSKSGDLKLDTDTLSYEDIEARERGIGVGAGMKFEGAEDTAKREKKAAERQAEEAKQAQKLENIRRGLMADGSERPADIHDVPIRQRWEMLGHEVASWDVVDNQIGKLSDSTKQIIDDFKLDDLKEQLESIGARPINTGISYQDSYQQVKATVGEGEIIIRSNPEQDLLGLNRNADKSVTNRHPLLGNLTDELKLDFIMKDPLGSLEDVVDDIRKADNSLLKLQEEAAQVKQAKQARQQ